MQVTILDQTTFVLDRIAFRPSLEELQMQLMVKEGSPYLAELSDLVKHARMIAQPRAMVKLAYIDQKLEDAVVIGGITLRSRVLRINLEKAQRVFLYIATCGVELEEWSNTLDDFLYRYWVDVIKEAALDTAVKVLDAYLTGHFKLGHTATMAPGSLADWPICEQRPLFDLLGDPQAAIGVRLTESFLMIPSKTISGIRFPTETRFESCQLCPRQDCPTRRAPYEPTLYSQKYQGVAANPSH